MDKLNYRRRVREMSVCTRCNHPFSPEAMTRLTLKEPKLFSKNLELCPKCTELVKKVIFIKK